MTIDPTLVTVEERMKYSFLEKFGTNYPDLLQVLGFIKAQIEHKKNFTHVEITALSEDGSAYFEIKYRRPATPEEILKMKHEGETREQNQERSERQLLAKLKAKYE